MHLHLDMNKKNRNQFSIFFPKKREALPLEYQNIYASYYKKNREGETKATALSIKMERWLHKQVAKDVENTSKDVSTLEIGAGALNHLRYEPNIISYDIVEPFTELFERSNQLRRVKNIFKDILDIDANAKYSRITSIATFEHIVDLPVVVAKAALLLINNGSLRIAIPNEGTVLWKFGTMITGTEFKKLYGLDYQVLMKYEHVNTADEIEAVLQYFFKKTKTNVCGINKNIAFYRFICCEEPNIDKATQYLKTWYSI